MKFTGTLNNPLIVVRSRARYKWRFRSIVRLLQLRTFSFRSAAARLSGREGRPRVCNHSSICYYNQNTDDPITNLALSNPARARSCYRRF